MMTKDPFAGLGCLDRPIRIGCLGECMVELSDLAAPDGRVAMGFAGDTLNFAIYLARCVEGRPVEVSYLTALGQDQLSDRMITFIRAQGVDVGSIARLEGKLPGIYAIELDGQGERSFRYWRSQSAAKSMLQPGGLDLDMICGFDVLALSAISLAILDGASRLALMQACAAMKAAGKLVVFDSNYRPALWQSEDEARGVIGAMWAATSLALPSRDDEARLWPGETPNDLFARLGVAEGALKDGAGGPWLWCEGAMTRDQYPPAMRVVDTTSAGDSFNAGYLAARLAGHDIRQAARAGHHLASIVIGQKGAIIARELMPRTV